MAETTPTAKKGSAHAGAPALQVIMAAAAESAAAAVNAGPKTREDGLGRGALRRGSGGSTPVGGLLLGIGRNGPRRGSDMVISQMRWSSPTPAG